MSYVVGIGSLWVFGGQRRGLVVCRRSFWGRKRVLLLLDELVLHCSKNVMATQRVVKELNRSLMAWFLEVKTVQVPLSYVQTLASLMDHMKRKTRQELSYTPQSHV